MNVKQILWTALAVVVGMVIYDQVARRLINTSAYEMD